VGAFTTYDLFTSKDANPALIGLTPTNIPQQTASLWADYTLQEGPLRGLWLGGGVRYIGKSFADMAKHAAGSLGRARRRGGSTTNGKNWRRGAERHQRRRYDLCRKLCVGYAVLLW
jgi:outer membrane receptor protein involved in Fe transport